MIFWATFSQLKVAISQFKVTISQFKVAISQFKVAISQFKVAISLETLRVKSNSKKVLFKIYFKLYILAKFFNYSKQYFI